FKIIFLLAIVVETAWEIFLTHKNIVWTNKNRGKIPSYLAGKTSSDELTKSADYLAAKGVLATYEGLYNLVIIFAVILFGVIGTIDSFLAPLGNIYLRAGIFFFLITEIQNMLNLPFSIYRTFVIEERFGFNKTTPELFFKDLAKEMIVGILVTIPLLLGVVWFISEYNLWWLYSWVLILSFSLFMTWLYPIIIAPLFNKFTLLPDGELKNLIKELAEKLGISIKEIRVMDASRRSGHSNAYFTGFGKVKRIVIFDTLIEILNNKELLSVLAHELGHFKKRHILKRIFLLQILLLAGLYLASLGIGFDWAYKGLGLNINNWSAIVVFALVAPRLTFWFTPLSSWHIRSHEFEADSYAKEIIGTGEHLQSALIALEKNNLSNPEPDPLYKKWYYSHPTVGERIDALS
ncbi:MAG: M48 family metallopeptidase, partial [Nitrospinota bacterium]